MNNLRKYGNPPFNVVVVHGGPGAAGEMAPIAEELSSDYSVLEPLQTALSLKGQVEELRLIIENHSDYPSYIIGFSWGAWLSFLCAAHYPHLIKKLIIIGSGPFEEKYAARICKTRLKRLNIKERAEIKSLSEVLQSPPCEDKDMKFARLGELFSKADVYDPIPYYKNKTKVMSCDADTYFRIWPEAAQLRSTGKLLKCGNLITCPIVAIHGDYDPHPAEGVEKPLSQILNNFQFILLTRCGHKPWIEQEAREKFFQILKKQLR